MNEHILSTVDQWVQSIGLVNWLVRSISSKIGPHSLAAADSCPPGGAYQCSRSCGGWGPTICQDPTNHISCHSRSCNVNYGAITGGGCVGNCTVIESQCWFDTSCH
jgi:hypothetical protein